MAVVDGKACNRTGITCAEQASPPGLTVCFSSKKHAMLCWASVAWLHKGCSRVSACYGTHAVVLGRLVGEKAAIGHLQTDIDKDSCSSFWG